MKRVFRRSAVLLAAVLALTCCFIAGTGYASGNIDLTFTAWSYGVETVNDNIAKFEQMYPGIKVSFSDFSWFDYHDIMATRFFSKTPTDVCYSSDHWLQEWAAAGWIVPLEDYFPWVRESKSEFAKYAVEGMTYQGKLYGVPYYADLMIFIYNEDMLKKAGFNHPPTTWEELAEQAKVMKAKGICKYPIIFEFGQQEAAANEVFISMVYSRKDGHMFNGLEPVFNAPGSAALKTVEWITDGMQNSKIIDPSSLTMAEIELVKSMQAGQHAFTILPKYNLAELNNPASSKLAGKFKMALMPGDTHETVGYVRFYAMTKMAVDRGKDVVDAVGKFIQYFGGKTNGKYIVEKRWAVEKGLGFAQLPLYDDPDVIKAINSWGDVKLELEQAKLARAKEGLSPFYGTWDLFVRTELHKAYLGQQSPKQVLDSCASKWNEMRKK